MKKQIVIGQRGWVFIGNVTKVETTVIIDSCMNIRRWGTTKGLGELATKGPTDTTVLDAYGRVQLHELSVVAMIDVVADKWPQLK